MQNRTWSSCALDLVGIEAAQEGAVLRIVVLAAVHLLVNVQVVVVPDERAVIEQPVVDLLQPQRRHGVVEDFQIGLLDHVNGDLVAVKADDDTRARHALPMPRLVVLVMVGRHDVDHRTLLSTLDIPHVRGRARVRDRAPHLLVKEAPLTLPFLEVGIKTNLRPRGDLLSLAFEEDAKTLLGQLVGPAEAHAVADTEGALQGISQLPVRDLELDAGGRDGPAAARREQGQPGREQQGGGQRPLGQRASLLKRVH
mmetsp:Transcript_108970/g.347917  ORF Transcript_108970/g.347917 Transcript_108970/m.347917 type:complete len:254 (-) Transcript_108970:63-824(-)